MSNEVAELRERVEKLKRELAFACSNNHERNVELDALHYVWCSGSCERGIHRYGDHELTREMVEAAIRNTERLIQKWNNLHRGETEQIWRLDEYRVLRQYSTKYSEAMGFAWENGGRRGDLKERIAEIVGQRDDARAEVTRLQNLIRIDEPIPVDAPCFSCNGAPLHRPECDYRLKPASDSSSSHTKEPK